jgi:hypothetical protein
MVKATYDLDLICYFRHDETAAGEPPEDLYENTRKALEADYWVEPKASALPLMERNL